MDEFSTSSLESRPPAQPVPQEGASSSPAAASDKPQRVAESLGVAEQFRIRLAWARMLWLLSFLAVLLCVTMIVPYLVTEVFYAASRGKMRAEYEFAREELKGRPLAQVSRGFQLVARKVRPSVVQIAALNRSLDSVPMSSMRMPGSIFESPSPGQGSGVIVDAEKGFIITNYHVIQGAQEIRVRLADQKPVTAVLIGHDPESDIAVLRIRREDIATISLVAAEWGDSESLEVGSFVLAMGSPYGLEHTVTLGMVSAKHRANQVGNPLQDFLQTDAAINPGNSGGPLVDDQGRVVGINTAIVGENYQGISFAVPSKVVREVYSAILSDAAHAVRRGYLGIRPEAMNDERARAAGMKSPLGVYVRQVEPDSPAASILLRAGDIILRWNGTEVSSPADLTQVICATEIGTEAKLVIWRDGKEVELVLTVGERPRSF